MKVLQRTLALLKPDLVASGANVEEVLGMIKANGFTIVNQKRLLLSRSRAEEFYGEHKGKFFFNRLCGYMSSGDLVALELEGENAIIGWRSLMGPTHPPRARISAPNSIRALFGITDTRNSSHGSDSVETARRELDFFFPRQ